eukprot:2014786-Amphidinium_carterae.6
MEVESDHEEDVLLAVPLFTIGETSTATASARRGRPSRTLHESVARYEQTLQAERSIGNAVVRSITSSSRVDGVAPRLQEERLVVFQQAGPLSVQSNLGLAPLIPLTDSLLAAANLCKQGVEVDTHTLDLAERHLDPDEFILTSISKLEQEMHMDSRAIQSRLERVATILLCHKHEEGKLQRVLATSLPQKHLLLLLDFGAHDETPMLSTVKHAQNATQLALAHTGDLMSADQCLSIEQLQRALPTPKVVTSAKLLQMKSFGGFLIDLMGRTVFIRTCALDPFAAMGKANAECLQRCLTRICSITSAASAFKFRLRTLALDQGSANVPAEASIKNLRSECGGAWHNAIFPCCAHIISGCFKRTFDGLMESSITGLIRTAMSILEGGKMMTFRKALLAELQSRPVKLIKAPLSAEAKKHFESDLHLACSGDIRSYELEHVACAGQGVADVGFVRSLKETILVPILTQTQPGIFPRHRWTGSEESIRWFCVLSHIHQLLKPTHQRFLQMVDHDKSHVADFAAPISEDKHDEDLSIGAGADTLHSEAQDVMGTSIPMAVLNSQNRAKAWMGTDVHTDLLLMQLLVIPLTNLLDSELILNGKKAECLQRVAQAKAVMSGNKTFKRTWPLLQAAKHWEINFFKELSELLISKHLWELFSKESRTFEVRSLAHRLIARSGACVYQLLFQQHDKFPTKLMELIDSPGKSHEFAMISSCLKDDWTQALQQEYPTLNHPHLIAILVSQCSGQPTNIAEIESKHASVRRQIVSRIVQTWRCGIAQSSAQWILQNCRSFRHSHASKPCTKKQVHMGKNHSFLWGV